MFVVVLAAVAFSPAALTLKLPQFQEPLYVAAAELEGLVDNSGETSVKISELDQFSEREHSEVDLGSQQCNLFTLWNYPGRAPLFARLNVESWRRHSHGLCNEPVLVNDTSVKTYIPDLPEEYFKLPYEAAKSDAIRYALIYHHGGLYLDTDFLVVKDLDKVVELLQVQDLVSYQDTGGAGDGLGQCTDAFSSNFIAGKKGSAFHKSVWEKQKKLMTAHCPVEHEREEVVCCFDDPGKQCHVPWASLGEWVSHGVARELQGGGGEFLSTCFQAWETFVPAQFAYVLDHVPVLAEAATHFEQFYIQRPFDRVAYHLFNSLHHYSDLSCEGLFNASSVVGLLYIKSFTQGSGRSVFGDGSFVKANPDFEDLSTPGREGIPCANVSI